MKIVLVRIVPAILLAWCTGCNHEGSSSDGMNQETLRTQTVREHVFLTDMYADDYFPDHLVDKCKAVLVRLCHRIESEKPKELSALYSLSHGATEEINSLQGEFDAQGSEIETAAREGIAMEFAFIAEAYGFDADIEELIAPREW